MRVFAGYDEREAIGFHVFTQSLLETSPGVGVQPLVNLAPQRDGSNAFTYSRFCVPQLCGFSGPALYVDGSDMLLLEDIKGLFDLFDPRYAVQVVKHDYLTRHSRKYVGTEMEADNADYPRKNWSSVILWNCGHQLNVQAKDALKGSGGAFLHRFSWLPDELIGSLPVEWNWLADEYGVNTAAKLLHWTAGVPGFYAYKDAPHSDEWRGAVRRMQRGLS